MTATVASLLIAACFFPSAFFPSASWRGGVHASERAKGGQQPKPYAIIFGTVWDSDGHPLYGVKVNIRRAEEKKVRWELYSNHTGEFAQRVPAGDASYVVWADVKGYKLASGKRLKPGSEVTRPHCK